MFKKIGSLLGALLVVFQIEVKADSSSVPSSVEIVFQNILIKYHIHCIHAFAISGNPAPLIALCPVPGSCDFIALDSTTTYAVTTNNRTRRITAVLASNMPNGVTLSVSLVPPKGATKMGFVELSATPAAVVTGISNISEASLGITYMLHATTAAKKVTGALNTVTYTIGP